MRNRYFLAAAREEVIIRWEAHHPQRVIVKIIIRGVEVDGWTSSRIWQLWLRQMIRTQQPWWQVSFMFSLVTALLIHSRMHLLKTKTIELECSTSIKVLVWAWITIWTVIELLKIKVSILSATSTTILMVPKVKTSLLIRVLFLDLRGNSRVINSSNAKRGLRHLHSFKWIIISIKPTTTWTKVAHPIMINRITIRDWQYKILGQHTLIAQLI